MSLIFYNNNIIIVKVNYKFYCKTSSVCIMFYYSKKNLFQKILSTPRPKVDATLPLSHHRMTGPEISNNKLWVTRSGAKGHRLTTVYFRVDPSLPHFASDSGLETPLLYCQIISRIFLYRFSTVCILGLTYVDWDWRHLTF